MAITVKEASEAYQRAMRNVQPAGAGICTTCSTFIEPAYDRCYRCTENAVQLDAVASITYSEHLGQLHTALRNYKEQVGRPQRYAMVRLAAILWRFLERHEPCVAAAAGTERFDVVTTVPSSMPDRDDARASLRTMVGWIKPISDRYERVLRATGHAEPGRHYDETRYAATQLLDDQAVLLIDDTWVGGGHAQSAGHALRAAGASVIGFVAIGRHIQPGWHVGDSTSGELLQALPRRFDWDECAVH